MEPNRKAPNWIDSYYEALEFFYAEPQHMRPTSDAAAELETLAKIAKQSSKLDGVLNHLRKMEVTLNHNIKQLFLLAPDTLMNDLFGKIFNGSFDGTFVMQGRDVDAEFELDNCTQPDFLFISQPAVVSIEMK
jgi:hypothetical protein